MAEIVRSEGFSEQIERGLLVAREEGLAINTEAVLSVLTDSTLPEAKKIESFALAFLSVSKSASRGEIEPKDLRKLIKGLVELDDSKGSSRIRKALTRVPEGKRALITQELSVDFMLKLGMIDLEFCDPKRMASYIRFFADRYEEGYKRLRYSSKRGYETNAHLLNIVARKVILLVEVTIERDTEDEGFMHRVVASLQDSREGTPGYIIRTLKDLTNIGNEGCECFLEELVGWRATMFGEDEGEVGDSDFSDFSQ